MNQPLMPKATAVWLVDNTALTFDQIADYVGMHPLEISGIADGEVAQGIKGADPVVAGQLARDDIDRCEKDSKRRLKLLRPASALEGKRKGPRYTPLSKRQERPAAIAWLIRNHPELSDGQIGKLVGTTKPTIQSVRDKTHWNTPNIRPVDPVALGMCRQIELDEAVGKAASRRPKTDDDSEQGALMSTEESLAERSAPKEPALDPNFAKPAPKEEEEAPLDPEALFNLPKRGSRDEEEED